MEWGGGWRRKYWGKERDLGSQLPWSEFILPNNLHKRRAPQNSPSYQNSLREGLESKTQQKLKCDFFFLLFFLVHILPLEATGEGWLWPKGRLG